MGILVAIFICKAGIGIALENMRVLLGEAPDRELIRVIYEHIAGYDGVKGIHDLMVHNYGPSHYIASLHVEVDGKIDIFELHDTIDLIEKTIHDELNILCTIHMDPIVTNDETVSELREFVVTTIRGLDETLSIHDFRTVIGKTHTNLIFDVLLPFENKKSPDEVMKMISTKIIELRPNHYCVITIDRG